MSSLADGRCRGSCKHYQVVTLAHCSRQGQFAHVVVEPPTVASKAGIRMPSAHSQLGCCRPFLLWMPHLLQAARDKLVQRGGPLGVVRKPRRRLAADLEDDAHRVHLAV